MPRFVILRHKTPAGHPRPSHWDFMLETEGSLRTWALQQPPRAGQPVDGRALSDHRIDYLDYEGPVSGGRGEVTRWESGEYTVTLDTDARLVVKLAGQRLRGTITAVRQSEDASRWRFVFEDDPDAAASG